MNLPGIGSAPVAATDVEASLAAEPTAAAPVPGFEEAIRQLLRAPRPEYPAAARALVASPPPGTLQFSRHAQARLASRGIVLDERDLVDLGHAVDTLGRRGAKESLLLLQDHAFIVGVPDRRVITAMTRKEAVGTVFTQIDSTIVVR